MNRTIALTTLALSALLGTTGCGGDKSGAVVMAAGDKPTFMRTEGQRHSTGPFQGVKANTGYAIHWTENGKGMLRVSDDFVIPDTPAPSWQVVDSRGNVYLLNQMKIKDGTNRQIVLPGYISDISKVQCWCSFAEVLLGEASFDRPVSN